jgi:hypothetical protein
LTNFGKKLLPLHRRQFKSLFFLFFCFAFFLPIDPSNDFCFCKFFAKGLKSEGERLKVKFWSLEMVKIGMGQYNYRRCRSRHSLRRLVMMTKNSVNRSAMDALRNSKKISLLAVAILFLFTFFNLILDAPRTFLRFFLTLY